MDLWPLYLFHPGALTLNFALSILTSCRVTPLKGKRIELYSIDTQKEESYASLDDLRKARAHAHVLAAHLVRFFSPEQGFRIETNSESPAGAGISGSSAMMIATTAALARFTGRELSLEEMRVIAQNVEAQIINVPTGCQDYYPALYGGVSAIHLDPDGIHWAAMPVAAEEIERRFVLAYTGAPRKSGINNWEVFKSHIDGNKHVFRNFERIAAIAREMHQALLRHADIVGSVDVRLDLHRQPEVFIVETWERRGERLILNSLGNGRVIKNRRKARIQNRKSRPDFKRRILAVRRAQCHVLKCSNGTLAQGERRAQLIHREAKQGDTSAKRCEWLA